jgi:lambda family phage portal protein
MARPVLDRVRDRVLAVGERLGVLTRIQNSASVYEAGGPGRRALGWRAPTTSANSGVLSQLATLRDRSRQAVRNNGYAKGVIDKLVSNIVGTGIKPLSQAQDPEFRRAVQELWRRWTDTSDADGLLDFYGQERQIVRTWLEAGEVFVRLRPRFPGDDLPVSLQVQVLEPEMCPYTHNGVRPNGNRVRAGIEFNGIGKRVAYWFHPSRPGDLNDWEAGDLRAVPAESVLHIYDPLRPGQLRGIPHLTQALIRLHELDKYDDATLLRQQISNLFVAFLNRPNSEGAELHPLTGLAPDDSSGEKPVLDLQPGIFQELGPGEEVTFSDPPDAGQGYVAFMRQQLYHIAAATGVPYQVLTGDMTGVNDRVVRVILHEFRRSIQAWQHQIVGFQLCHRVWRAWLDRAFLSGAIAIPFEYLADAEPWAAVRWMAQGWPYLHPVQDVEAAKAAIRCGFTSRSAVVSEQGEDAEAIDAEQSADNKRADDLGLRYDSDGRATTGGSGGGAPPSPEPEPEEDTEKQPAPEEVPA